MEQIFKDKLATISKDIQSYSDEYLNGQTTIDDQYDKYKFDYLEVDKANIRQSLGNITLTHKNAPVGMSYYNGQEINYVEYAVPILGDTDLIHMAHKGLNNLDKRNGQWYEHKTYYIRIFSTLVISGNDANIEKLAAEARNLVISLENAFKSYEPQIKEFNDYLKIFIRTAIKDEIKKRQTDSQSLDKLKLF